MNLKEIRYITTICETENLSKAAKILYVSQPALSKFIRCLEMDIGTNLFERVGNRLLITDAGKIYLEAAKVIIDTYDTMKNKMIDVENGIGGHLRLGVTTFRGSYILPTLLSEYCNIYPQIEISLFEESAPVLEKLLLDGVIDIAFVKKPFSLQNFAYVLLYTEELLLSVPQDHPKIQFAVSRDDCKFPWIDTRKMNGETFILLKHGHRTRVIAEDIIKSANIMPKKIIQTDNIETAVGLSAAGLGISFIPELYAESCFCGKRPHFFSIGEPTTTSEFVIAYRNGQYISFAARKFIQIAVNHYRG